MNKRRSWTDQELVAAAKTSFSYRAVICALGLVPAGGNYAQVQQRLKDLKVDTSHFKGSAWNKGLKVEPIYGKSLEETLVKGNRSQSHVLKKRLFRAGLKQPVCELCGWNQLSADGRIPVELDHINGDHFDNRLENLRILCPNCHSLQSTHRGRNKKIYLTKISAGVVIGSRD